MTGYLTCPHRSAAIAILDGYTAGCGCASTPVEVFRCQRHHEPVLKQAAARCLDKIRARFPDYAGRTCRECQEPQEPCDGTSGV